MEHIKLLLAWWQVGFILSQLLPLMHLLNMRHHDSEGKRDTVLTPCCQSWKIIFITCFVFMSFEYLSRRKKNFLTSYWLKKQKKNRLDDNGPNHRVALSGSSIQFKLEKSEVPQKIVLSLIFIFRNRDCKMNTGIRSVSVSADTKAKVSGLNKLLIVDLNKTTLNARWMTKDCI